MTDPKRYVGIHHEVNGGMTDTGKIIRDAWAFGLIPESETCQGWMAAGIEDLWRKVNQHWEAHGFLVGNLPPEVKQRFLRIHNDAVAQARAAGWSGEMELSGDDAA